MTFQSVSPAQGESKTMVDELTFINHRHDAEDLNLKHITEVGNTLSDLDDINWVTVTVALSVLVSDGRVFPGLI